MRAKAGGRQSTKDATGKAPKSAGASLRRYNEKALQKVLNWFCCFVLETQAQANSLSCRRTHELSPMSRTYEISFIRGRIICSRPLTFLCTRLQRIVSLCLVVKMLLLAGMMAEYETSPSPHADPPSGKRSVFLGCYHLWSTKSLRIWRGSLG